jgi:broad specificity phosphatase PhoE
MGQILLVRHGQASWGADDYDVLSPVGEEQSAVLGRALAGVRPVEVVHGRMQRQRRTAELAAAAAGWSAPFREDQRWNEMDHLAILAAHPREGGSDPGGEPDRAQFQAWFEAATDRWTSGGFDDEYAESFPDFRARVAAALADLAGPAAEGTVVVVTSGGPISAVTADLLDAGTPSYTRLAPVVVNSSVTRLVTGRRGVTLVSFNEHAHLQGRDGLLTYR